MSAPGSNEWWTVRRVANGDAQRPWYELTDEDRAALGIAPKALREALACLWIPTAEQIDPDSYTRIVAARKMVSGALGQTPRPLLFCREDEDPVEYRALVNKIRREVDAEIAAEGEPLPDIREALGIPPCDPDIEKRFGPPTYTAEQVAAYARLLLSGSRPQGEEGLLTRARDSLKMALAPFKPMHSRAEAEATLADLEAALSNQGKPSS